MVLRLSTFPQDVQLVPVVMATGLAAAGTNQATGTALPAMENVIVTASGGYFTLQMIGVGIVQRVRNKDAANSATIYPSSGAQIDSYGSNTAVLLPAGGIIDFLPVSATQWYA